MKTLRLLSIFFSLLPALHAGVFKQAEVTRVLNDVRVVPGQTDPVPARIGDVITGKTAVATGVQSRAELRFPDKTLTRLGANTLFRLEEGTRDIEMERGVLLLQVPKQLGGARVRTAAVTAAVTGTTLMVEYQPDGYIKVIVIEGEVDLYLRESPSTFINLKAGDMILMKPDAKSFPLPVKVDLERLMATSKLLDPKEFGPIGNDKQIAGALADQEDKKKDGELMKTAFMLPGRGTRVSLTNEVRRELLRFQKPVAERRSPPEDRAGPGGQGERPARQRRVPILRPYIPGTTVVSDQDPIATNPHLTAYNSLADDRVTSSGFFFNPPADGGPGRALFDRAAPGAFDSLVRDAGLWAAFYFEDLVINGNPTINSLQGARNLLLASETGIALRGESHNVDAQGMEVAAGAPAGSGVLVLDSSLDTFMLASHRGAIVVDENFQLSADGGQRILFQTFGADADIVIQGYQGYYTQIDAPESAFHAAAGRDIQFQGAGIRADEVDLQAKRDIHLTQGTQIRAMKKIAARAGRDLYVSDSTQLRSLAEPGLQEIVLAAGGDLSVLNATLDAVGEVTLEAKAGDLLVTNSVLSGDVIRARALGPNGQLVIDGAQFYAGSLLRLYAEGSSGHIRFISDSALYGSRVDIAAKTVTINPGVDVEVSHPAGLSVYTQNANYNRPSAPNGNGRFVSGGDTVDAAPKPFGSRPGFNAP